MTDVCEYCQTRFEPSSSDRACRVCGVPRENYESYSAARQRKNGKGVPFGSGDVHLRPNSSLSVTIHEGSRPVWLVDFGINDPTGLAYLIGVSVGADELVSRLGSTAVFQSASHMMRSAGLWNFDDVFVAPWRGLSFALYNPTCGVIQVNCWAIGLLAEEKRLRPPPEPRTRLG